MRAPTRINNLDLLKVDGQVDLSPVRSAKEGHFPHVLHLTWRGFVACKPSLDGRQLPEFRDVEDEGFA
jgi:hypothetical protein